LKKRKDVKEDTLKRTIKHLIQGLAHIHSCGVMHRDLKPENIMLTNKKKLYSVKVIDFGLSAFLNDKPYLYKRCGTPGFVAPEIIVSGNDMNYDYKCDIFSAGVILYLL